MRRSLLAWYRKHARPLPWRATRDPYHVWLSEILLQQTRMEAGLPYWERFVRELPDVHALAAAPRERILKLWEGLGYYSRAHRLHETACIIAHDHGGRFPVSAADWQALPGIGRYTAGAIASIVHGERAPVVDGNVRRVLARLFALESATEDAAGQETLWALAERLLPPRRGRVCGDWNQALMELGALVCLPRSPRCMDCPLRRDCAALAADSVERYPLRQARKQVPQRLVAAGWIERDEQILLGQRKDGGMLAGLWELPGGSVREDELPKQALARVLHEELGLRVSVGEEQARVAHAFSHFRMDLRIYSADVRDGPPACHENGGYSAARWVRLDALDDYALPTADRKAIELMVHPKPARRRSR